MATIGGSLLNPESGWNRYDDTDGCILYSNGTWTRNENHADCYNQTKIHCPELGATITFKLKGNAFRIIGTLYPSFSSNIEVNIDNEIIESFSEVNPKNVYVGAILVYEKLGLREGIHTITLTNKTSASMQLDAIDTMGELIPVLSKQYEFPVGIIDENDVEEYAAELIYDEEQLLITRDGNLYLTKGDGTYVPVGSNGSSADIPNEDSHSHENKEIIDKINETNGNLLYDGKKINNYFALSTLAPITEDFLLTGEPSLPRNNNVNLNATTDGSPIALGTSLPTPSAGWKRIDCTHKWIQYYGNWHFGQPSDSWYGDGYYHNNADETNSPVKDYIAFKFKGHSLRIIGRGATSNRGVQIINIDGKDYAFTQCHSKFATCSLDFHITGLDDTTHTVIIKRESSNYMYFFDSFDIDSWGYITEIISDGLEFPIKIGTSEQIELYSSKLLSGEEQLLIDKNGEMYLTDGQGGYKQIGGNSQNGDANIEINALKTDVKNIKKVIENYDIDEDGIIDNAKNIKGIEDAHYLTYYGRDINGNIGFHSFPVVTYEQGSINQAVKLNVTPSSSYAIDLANTNPNGDFIIQCFKFISGEKNVSQTLKEFNNGDNLNFFYDNENVNFNGTINIKDEHNIESSVINTNSFVEIYEIMEEQYE